MPQRSALILALVWLIASCTTLRDFSLSNSPYPTRPLANPAGPALRATQSVSGTWDGHEQTMICALELDEHRIAIAAISEGGLNLFSLEYDGKTLTLNKSTLVPEKLDPQAVVADLQLAFWPATLLRHTLGPDWHLEVAPGVRRLYRYGRLEVELNYQTDDPWLGMVSLNDYRLNYRLNVITLDKHGL